MPTPNAILSEVEYPAFPATPVVALADLVGAIVVHKVESSLMMMVAEGASVVLGICRLDLMPPSATQHLHYFNSRIQNSGENCTRRMKCRHTGRNRRRKTGRRHNRKTCFGYRIAATVCILGRGLNRDIYFADWVPSNRAVACINFYS